MRGRSWHCGGKGRRVLLVIPLLNRVTLSSVSTVDTYYDFRNVNRCVRFRFERMRMHYRSPLDADSFSRPRHAVRNSFEGKRKTKREGKNWRWQTANKLIRGAPRCTICWAALNMVVAGSCGNRLASWSVVSNASASILLWKKLLRWRLIGLWFCGIRRACELVILMILVSERVNIDIYNIIWCAWCVLNMKSLARNTGQYIPINIVSYSINDALANSTIYSKINFCNNIWSFKFLIYQI